MQRRVRMTTETTSKIRKLSSDPETNNALLVLLDYYGKIGLAEITEEEGLAFLEKLKNGIITIKAR